MLDSPTVKNEPISVVHIGNSDNTGGAAKAMFRVHRSLIHIGERSSMLVIESTTGDSSVECLSNKIHLLAYKIKCRISLLIIKLLNKGDINSYCSINIFHSKLLRKIQKSNAQIAHLHWVGGEVLSISDIGKINKPIVWTLHDMWPILGSSHIDSGMDIARLSNNCMNAESSILDVDQWVYNRKRKEWSMPIHFICPSKWVADMAKRSIIPKNWSIDVIGNPIDCEIWFPRPTARIRKMLNIPENKKVVLSGAYNFFSDKNKGYDLLLSALDILSDKSEQFLLILFGIAKECKVNTPAGINVIVLENLSDNDYMAQLYSCSDVVVVPSRVESYGQIAAEAQACGAPVVCFDNSGLTDIVVHKNTGYLATAHLPSSLAQGINWVLSSGNIETIRQQSRVRVCQKFSKDVIAKKHSLLYREII